MIFIASDHAGFELKEKLKKYLSERAAASKVSAASNDGLEDLGTDSADSCDYPVFAEALCKRVLENENALGVLICGSGIGMSIAANKVKGIRAAVVSEEKSAALAREHNKAQVLCLGARIIDFQKAKECLEAFLTARFDESNPRHQRRIDAIAGIEKTQRNGT